jgi:hypothetical protein
LKPLLLFLMLPFRAPLVLVLLAVSVHLGLSMAQPLVDVQGGLSDMARWIWSAECLQALVVVAICCMPDVLLRQVSMVMAASRAASLVITLLIVSVGGLYLLHLNVLANLLILASSTLLARLDLLRVRMMPPPALLALLLCSLVLLGMNLGRWLHRLGPVGL